MENRKLRRNPMNRVIGGVCSGLADFFGVDVALMRIAFVIAFLFASFGFWLYVILWIVLPENGQQTTDNGQQDQSQQTTDNGQQDQSQRTTDEVQQSIVKRESKVKSIFAGAFIILIGLLFLVNNFIPINWVWKLWPLILVAIGVVMIVTASKK